jgi:hypothetical protein
MGFSWSCCRGERADTNYKEPAAEPLRLATTRSPPRFTANGCLIVFDPDDPSYDPIGLPPLPPRMQATPLEWTAAIPYYEPLEPLSAQARAHPFVAPNDPLVDGKLLSERTLEELYELRVNQMKQVHVTKADFDLIFAIANAIHAKVQD